MNTGLKKGLIALLNAIIQHGNEGEFDMDIAKKIAPEYVERLESEKED